MTRLCSFWLLAVAVLALAPGVAVAQPRAEDRKNQPAPISAEGTEVFRWLLHAKGIKPLTEHDIQFRNDYSTMMVVILGDPGHGFVGPLPPLGWAAHVARHGGAVLVACDTHVTFGNFFDGARTPQGWIEVRGKQVDASLQGTYYPPRPSCPYAVPVPRENHRGPEWDLFDGLNRVATNQPSHFNVPAFQGEFKHALAGFPDWCSFGNVQYNQAPKHFPLAVGSSGPHKDSGAPYRFLAVADPSIFINQMLLAEDRGDGHPDNLTFASRVVSFLSEEGGTKQRTECLFIQNGQVVTHFDDLRTIMLPPRPPIPLPSIDKMQDKIVDAGNQIVDKLQENNALNNALLGTNPAQQNHRLKIILNGLLYLSIIVILRILRLMWRFKQPTDIPPPPPGGLPPPPKASGTGGLFDRRQRELARRNNLYEPVRAAVREMFLAAGAPPDAGPKLPKVVVADAVRRADTLREALRDLWKIAFGRPAVVTAQHWRALEPLFERVRAAHADGKWRFVVADPDAISTTARGSQA